MIPDREPTQWDFDLADVYHKLETCDPDFFTQTDKNAEKALKTCESIVNYFANKNEPIKDVTPEDLSFLGDRIKLFIKAKEDDLKKDKKESLPERTIPKDIENRANAVFNILHPDNPEIANLLSLPPDVKKEIFKSLEDKELGSASISSKGLKNIADTINKFRMHAVLAQAQELAKADKSTDYMTIVCEAQIHLDDIKGALSSINDVDVNNRPALDRLLFKKLIEIGSIEQADKLAEEHYEILLDPDNSILIIEALAEIGDVEGVKEKLKYLPTGGHWGLTCTAIYFAMQDDNKKAVEEIDKISELNFGVIQKIDALCKIAKLKMIHGLREEAAYFFDKAQALADQAAQKYDSSIILSIGVIQAKNGDLERARANFIIAKSKTITKSSEEVKDVELPSIFEAQLEAGFLEDAKDTSLLLNPKLHPISYSYSLCDVATLQAERGDLTEAEKTIHLIQINIYKTMPLAVIIKKLAAKGKTAEALNFLRQIENPYEKIIALMKIYKAQIIAKDVKGAEISFNKALELLKFKADKNENSYLTYELAKAKATFGKFTEAEELVKDLWDEYKIRLLLYISKIQAQNNELENSQKTFDRAIELLQNTANQEIPRQDKPNEMEKNTGFILKLLQGEFNIKLFKEIYE